MRRAATKGEVRIQPLLNGNLAITPRGLARSTAESLPIALQRIIAQLNPEKIILFGSYAYGVPTPDSDVDLLIILKTTASAKDRYLVVSNLLYPRLFPVDILVKTPQEIEQALKRGDFFIKELLSKGHVLYERHQ
jgi:predicted nucleotidyltransferase